MSNLNLDVKLATALDLVEALERLAVFNSVAYSEERYKKIMEIKSEILNRLTSIEFVASKEELYQDVKAGKISLNDAREKLGLERIYHPLMDSKLTNAELLSRKGRL